MRRNSALAFSALILFSFLLVGEPTAAQTTITLPQTDTYLGEQGGLYPGGG